MKEQSIQKTEKLTINVNYADLGKVDLLVGNGFFTNRSDFFKTALREKLLMYDDYLKETIDSQQFSLGIVRLSNDNLTEYLAEGKRVSLKVAGLLVIDNNIDQELLQKTVKKIDVKGKMIAPTAVKKIYAG